MHHKNNENKMWWGEMSQKTIKEIVLTNFSYIIFLDFKSINSVDIKWRRKLEQAAAAAETRLIHWII